LAAKTILILGAGTGGLVAAHRLRRTIAKEHRVVLVDRSPLYTFAPSYSWVMTGMRDARRISRDLRTLEKKGIKFVMGEVERIDPQRKRVQAAGREHEYDHLIIALGAEYSSEAIEGLGQSWTFFHLEGAEGLAERLQTFKSGCVAIVASALPYKCPTALYEGAFLLDDHLRRRNVRAGVEIHVYTPEEQPLQAVGPSVGDRIVELLSERDIGFTPSAQLKAVDHRTREIRFGDGSTAGFDLLIATPIHHCPDVVREANLVGQSGWVEVDRETLATQFEGVYAIGDAINVALDKPASLPKAGTFAHGQAEVVARNIAAEIAGGEGIWAFGGQGSWFMSTAQDRAAQITGNFFAEGGPELRLRGPSRRWHWTKLGYERLWLWRWF
jgi:sulfide:quinone oxidoreductase